MGPERHEGGELSRPSIYDGIEQYLFLIIRGEDGTGCAADPDQLEELMKLSGISEKQAWLIAEMNTLDDTETATLEDVLGALAPGGFNEKSLATVYVVSIKGQEYGAGAATLGVESFITEHGAKTLTVLPSSRHEMLLIPDVPEEDMEIFTKMVAEVNATEVDEDDRLTDRAYMVTLDPNGNAVVR